MALWSPKSSDPVGPNERIGRRLFDQKQLNGAQDQKPLRNVFELYHFEEKRDPGDVSVDRLGKTGIDRRVRNYVEERANFAASTFKPARQFLGWAVVSAKELQNPLQGPALSVIPSPLIATAENNKISENKYHAHIERPPHYAASRYAAYDMAMHLRTIFERSYHLEEATAQPHRAAETKSIQLKLLNWLRNKFTQI